MGWTDERVEMLKRLWAEGFSASQIADRLGGVSRNAVIGKVHRLKLESRAKVTSVGQTSAVVQPAAVENEQVNAPVAETVVENRFAAIHSVQAATMRSMPRTVGATALKMDPDEELEVHYEPSRQSGEVVPIARKLTLVQLTESTCKWPVGDPLQPDFHFCGNNARDASPYCEYHARLAFQPASERRRIR